MKNDNIKIVMKIIEQNTNDYENLSYSQCVFKLRTINAIARGYVQYFEDRKKEK